MDATISTTELLIALLWIGALLAIWQLTRGRGIDDRRPPIVGVQKHGRTYYIRKDTLDRFDAAGQPHQAPAPDWLARTHPHQSADKRGNRTGNRSRIIDRMIVILTVLASLIAGTVLLGQ